MSLANAHSVRRLIAGVCCMVVVGGASGCSTRTSGLVGGATAVQLPEGGAQNSEYVIVNNPQLARGIQVVDLKSVFAGDLLNAQVSVVSKYSRTLKFQYKFMWFNAQGMEIDAGRSPWIPMILNGNESKSIQAVAPNPAARQFKINIRPL